MSQMVTVLFVCLRGDIIVLINPREILDIRSLILTREVVGRPLWLE